jgi:hypothetical protein
VAAVRRALSKSRSVGLALTHCSLEDLRWPEALGVVVGKQVSVRQILRTMCSQTEELRLQLVGWYW